MRTTTKQDLLALKAIHALVAEHVEYVRVYSEKRYSNRPNVVLGHRIKYFICTPSDAILDLLNDALNTKGLYAARIRTRSTRPAWQSISLEIRRI